MCLRDGEKSEKSDPEVGEVLRLRGKETVAGLRSKQEDQPLPEMGGGEREGEGSRMGFKGGTGWLAAGFVCGREVREGFKMPLGVRDCGGRVGGGRMAGGEEGRCYLLSLPASHAMGGEVGRGDPSALTAPRLSPSQEASLLVLRQNQQWICLDTLTPGTLYEFQVRVRAYLGSHKAWSPWSQPLAFRTKPAGTRGQTGWDGAQTGGGWLMCDLGAAGRGGLGVGYRAWPQSCLPAIVSPLIATLQGKQPGGVG